MCLVVVYYIDVPCCLGVGVHYFDVFCLSLRCRIACRLPGKVAAAKPIAQNRRRKEAAKAQLEEIRSVAPLGLAACRYS